MSQQEITKSGGDAHPTDAANQETKHCTRCGLDRPIDQFHRVRKGKPARQAYCGDCINAIRRDLYKKAHA